MNVVPILLVESTPSIQTFLASILRGSGHEVVVARTAMEAQARFRQIGPDLVVLDTLLFDGDGRDLIRDFLTASPSIRIIAISADGSVDHAVSCMRVGACDYLVKPIREKELMAAVRDALAQVGKANDPIPPLGDEMIGSSQIFQDVMAAIRSVSRSNATVFLTGESGTGKSRAAQEIHALSDRASEKFVTVDCAAITAHDADPAIFGLVQALIAAWTMAAPFSWTIFAISTAPCKPAC